MPRGFSRNYDGRPRPLRIPTVSFTLSLLHFECPAVADGCKRYSAIPSEYESRDLCRVIRATVTIAVRGYTGRRRWSPRSVSALPAMTCHVRNDIGIAIEVDEGEGGVRRSRCCSSPSVAPKRKTRRDFEIGNVCVNILGLGFAVFIFGACPTA